MRQAYRKFCGAVAELIDGEFLKEEFEEVAKAVYRAFQGLGKNADDDTKIAESKYACTFSIVGCLLSFCKSTGAWLCLSGDNYIFFNFSQI